MSPFWSRMFETTYCFSRINEYYMNISMYPFLLKNVWDCFVYVNEHYVHMENSMDSFWPRVFETIFYA